MAPSPSALLEAATARKSELDEDVESAKGEIAALDTQIAEKRAERTIAAQNAVKDLLKDKEALMKKIRLSEGAAKHVSLALEKLQLAVAAGLDDWKALIEEKVAMSDFAQKRLKEDPSCLKMLEASTSGGKLTLEGPKLAFKGGSQGLENLKKALAGLESGYSCTVEVEIVMMGVLDRRDWFNKQADKHGVEVEKDANGTSVTISGPAEKAKKLADSLKFLLTGKADLYCVRDLIAPCRTSAKEIEEQTGAFIDVLKGGFGGGGLIYVRGDREGVAEAEEKMRAFIDAKEGKYSVFLDVPFYQKLDPEKAQHFENDLPAFGAACGMEAWMSEDKLRLEMRGPAANKNWETKARTEFKQLSGWYLQQLKEASKPKAPKEDDPWGPAPEAEFELGHKW
eukprot:CAMPEP_0206552302 /NCGR_PEP_ID=MMETSP0325_2-20121206/16011_1 /ASSEMBLY_ACC=CAM_ASM_000347 /TAXON_ID=2866 /ORGANISM="Crypthecodinium cohnii, Strain Seligo" /LENGTH=395 /DNA_ID=CAMNT_0054052173 /DNA_START=46 /DNA_END=1233 /DNA_ORIENTATION=+